MSLWLFFVGKQICIYQQKSLAFVPRLRQGDPISFVVSRV